MSAKKNAKELSYKASILVALWAVASLSLVVIFLVNLTGGYFEPTEEALARAAIEQNQIALAAALGIAASLAAFVIAKRRIWLFGVIPQLSILIIMQFLHNSFLPSIVVLCSIPLLVALAGAIKSPLKEGGIIAIGVSSTFLAILILVAVTNS